MIEPLRMARSPIALVVNEEEWLARSIEAVLVEHGYLVRRRGSARETLELLNGERPDAVIIDRRLPDTDGATLCRQLREDPRVGYSVPIAITSMVSLSAGERAEFFRAGAWDLWGPLLEPQVFAIKLDTFVSAKVAAEAQSSEALDPVTGLLNSKGLSRRAGEIEAVVSRVGAPLACIAITPAPRNGNAPSAASTDAGLRQLTKLWRPHGRAADCVGRLSDSELGVIAPGSDSAGATGMFRRLQDLLATAPTNGHAQPAPLVRAGYCASANLRESHVSIVEMLRRAALAVRYALAQTGGAEIVSYDDVSAEARS